LVEVVFVAGPEVESETEPHPTSFERVRRAQFDASTVVRMFLAFVVVAVANLCDMDGTCVDLDRQGGEDAGYETVRVCDERFDTERERAAHFERPFVHNVMTHIVAELACRRLMDKFFRERGSKTL
jgi:hypothetical protein